MSITVPPIPKAAWLDCLDAMTSFDGHLEEYLSLIDLLEKVAIAVDGYPVKREDPAWMKSIPNPHRLGYARGIASVYEPLVDKVDRHPEEVSIRFCSRWNGHEHKDLLHVFKPLSAQQLMNFRRGFTGPRRVESGERKESEAIFRDPHVCRMCTAIYDEFIVRVEGYAFDGEPLGSNRSLIVDNMDTYHKVFAAEVLVNDAPLQRYTGEKIGRNDCCPCGSGKKYKKCHGSN
jgi:hypothetical protein